MHKQATRPPGKPPHEPSKATRELVKLHAMVGTPQPIIADLIEIDDKTLRKYYRRELDLSTHQANAQVGGALYNKAVKGDTAAMIFWLKTRAGFREKAEEEKLTIDAAKTVTIVRAVRPSEDED